MPLTNPSNANNLDFTPGGTIASTKIETAILEAAAEALQKSNNLSDLASVSSAWSNLGGSQSLASSSGWIKLPNGLILQWVSVNIASQAFSGGTVYSNSVAFPVSFNTIYSWIGCQTGGAIVNGSSEFTATNSQATALYQFTVNVTTALNFKVFAIGI